MNLRSLLSLLLVMPLLASGKDKESTGEAAVYRTEENIPYYEEATLAKADAYQRATCVLDVYFPTNKPGFATIIWFHGGGLVTGHKVFPSWLKNKEFALVGVDYRLAPQAKLPEFLEDAGAATAWVFRNIAARGGDPKKIFISGHSAGAYLAAMVGMDPRWLAPYGISNRQLAGIIPLSGQMTTHNQIKKMRGDTTSEFREVIDEYAPLYYASRDLPPICLVTGDSRLDIKNRMEENALLAASLRSQKHPFVEFYELQGMNHGTSKLGAWLLVPGFIERVLKSGSPAAPAASSSPAAASEDTGE